eukprot:3108716-Pyramimonas_sp.AAC.1
MEIRRMVNVSPSLVPSVPCPSASSLRTDRRVPSCAVGMWHDPKDRIRRDERADSMRKRRLELHLELPMRHALCEG